VGDLQNRLDRCPADNFRSDLYILGESGTRDISGHPQTTLVASSWMITGAF